jgi:4-hydroxymandelate oxidase
LTPTPSPQPPGPVNLADYEITAQIRLPQMAYDYYASGANDEITLVDNHDAYDRIRLRYRVLRDISRRTTATTLLGHDLRLPVIVAPTAFQRMAHPDGELATARAAGRAGTLMILSTLSTTSIEDVTAAATGPVWFQLYVYKDRAATADLVRRAEAAGCSALVLTVDAQVWGRRERDVRNRFQLPPGLTIENLMPAGKQQFPQDAAGSGLAAYVVSLFDQTLSWPDVDWLCSLTSLPVLLKGIVHPDDARLALEHGAAGVIVSNHGGRQLDTAPATIDALPDIVAAIDGRLPVIIDGGVRRGTDVIKALALGADAVAIGRPVLWGLAAAGQSGVAHVLELLRAEIDTALALVGANTVAELGRDILM